MLARIRLFHNFCTIVNKENEISSNNQPVQSSSAIVYLRFSQRWQDFSGKYQYNQLCKRENILRNICCGQWAIFQKHKILCKFAKPTREVLLACHIWYDWRQPKHNFLLMKNPQWSHKIENGGNKQQERALWTFMSRKDVFANWVWKISDFSMLWQFTRQPGIILKVLDNWQSQMNFEILVTQQFQFVVYPLLTVLKRHLLLTNCL